MMRFSFAFAVLSVAAVSAGVYPVKTGRKGNSERTKELEDDRFHFQSPDGQYVFGHTAGNQGRVEMRDEHGTVTGYYKYVDDNGRMVYVNYIADKNGYRVLSNTGVPSASVTIEGSEDNIGTKDVNNFRQVFLNFIKRIKDKVTQQIGQKPVDPFGQSQVTVDPTNVAVYDNKHENKKFVPNWNEVKISTTQKPTDEKKYDEGQQQVTVAPNWNDVKITTQKTNIKDYNYNKQDSVDDWKKVKTTTEISSQRIPQQIQEIPEEINSRINTKSPEIHSPENNIAVTRPIPIINDIQTTISYYEESKQTTVGNIIDESNVQTTITGVKQAEESSSLPILEDTTTERNNEVIENKSKFPGEMDTLTTIIPLNEQEFIVKIPTTKYPSHRNDFRTIVPDIDYANTKTVNEELTTNNMPTSKYDEPNASTPQFDGKVSDLEVTLNIQYVTKENEDNFDFRTLEPTERFGTTSNPNLGVPEAQEQEIIWPEIPQKPVPQVLVPLGQYLDDSNTTTKNSGIKIQPIPINKRPLRYLELVEVKPTIDVLKKNKTITVSTNRNDEISTTFLNFPRYFLTG